MGFLDTALHWLFGLPYLLDILIGLSLVSGIIRGSVRGFWRSLWRFLFVLIILDITYLFLLDPLAAFVNEGFWSLTGWHLSVTVGGTLYQASSLTDFLQAIIQYADTIGYLPATSPLHDAAYVAGFAYALSKVLAWMVILVLTHLLSWILSSLLYLFPVRLLISPQAREHKFRPLGALFGLLTSAVYVLCFGAVLVPVHTAMMTLSGRSEDPYAWINSYVIEAGQALDPETSVFIGWVNYQGFPAGFLNNLTTFSVDEGGTEVIYFLNLRIDDFIDDTATPASGSSDPVISPDVSFMKIILAIFA